MSGAILLCAGGTGGHLFPAEALARELIQRGRRVELVTDHRVAGYGDDFPAAAVHIVGSGTPSGQGIAGKAKAAVKLGAGLLQALQLLRRVRPAAAVGFGGYPTVPPILAARMLRIPTIIHDQNAVLGRANRFLAGKVGGIATSTAALKLPPELARKAVLTGNPVRVPVTEAAKIAYPALAAGGPVRLAVFGGSQGARVMSTIVPAAIALLPEATRARLRLTQQCRPEDIDAVGATYRRLCVEAELAPFFRDLPARIAASHLVIARAGASTVTELGVIGRPAVLIPLPGAIDQDQKANAEGFVAAGGGWLMIEKELTAETLAALLGGLMAEPGRLQNAAAAAKAIGGGDGARRLADLVEAVAGGRPAAGLAATPLPSPPPQGGREPPGQGGSAPRRSGDGPEHRETAR